MSTTTPFKVCTYNVNNLFLSGEGFAVEARRFRTLGRMLTKVDADLVVLQEVGSLASLKLLNDSLPTPYAFVGLKPGNSHRSIHLGVLARRPCDIVSHTHLTLMTMDDPSQPLLEMPSADAVRDGAAQPAKLQRDIIKITLSWGAHKITVFGVHLKSRINQPWQIIDAQSIRAAEARLLFELVKTHLQTQADQPVVVLGDFNDVPSSDSLVGVARLVEELGFSDPHGDWAAKMGRNPTTYWPKRKCRFDRILLNSVASELLVPNSVMLYNSTMGKQASDHFPLSLQLQI